MEIINSNFERLCSLMHWLKRSRGELVFPIEDLRMADWLLDVQKEERDVDRIEEEITNMNTSKKLPRTRLHNRIMLCMIHLEVFIRRWEDIVGVPSDPNGTIIKYLEDRRTPSYSSEKIETFTGNFSEKIGSGGFGVVYKGQVSSGEPMAIKILTNKVDMGFVSKEKKADMRKQFYAEMDAMNQVWHPNLVKLHGVCYEDNMKALVIEYMENGSLDMILRKNHLDLLKLYNIAIGIAKGISYLHGSCIEEIIHFDIKPANVLLDAKFCPKVADFGISMLGEVMFQPGLRGTRGYIAPELTELHGHISQKCDVYSFGMILFDILGSKRNCVSQRWLPGQVWEKFRENQLDIFIKDCGIKEEEEVNAKTLATVALLCSEHDPENRPSLRLVVKMLQGEIQPWKPINPFPHYDSSAENSTIDDSRV